MNNRLAPVLTVLGLFVAFSCSNPGPKPPVVDSGDAAGDAMPMDAATDAMDEVVIFKGPDAAVDAAPPALSLNAKACKVLADLKCPEAMKVDGGDDCVTVLTKAQATNHMNMKPECIVAAKTQDAVRACGTVRCKK